MGAGDLQRDLRQKQVYSNFLQKIQNYNFHFVTRSPAGEYLTVYTRKSEDIAIRFGLNAGDFQGKIDGLRVKNYYPIISSAEEITLWG